jgi:hypothetical protein
MDKDNILVYVMFFLVVLLAGFCIGYALAAVGDTLFSPSANNLNNFSEKQKCAVGCEDVFDFYLQKSINTSLFEKNCYVSQGGDDQEGYFGYCVDCCFAYDTTNYSLRGVTG